MDKQKIILILGVLLALALGYILVGTYLNYSKEKDYNAFQQGVQYGYEQTVLQLAQQLSTCQQVSLRVENQSINVMAVECLQIE